MNLRNSDALPTETREEIEGLVGQINGFAYHEHHEDGSHGDVTADSVTIEGGSVGVWVDLHHDQARFYTDTADCTWTVSSDNMRYLKYMKVGRLVTIIFDIENSTLSGIDTAEDLYINVPELEPLVYTAKGLEVFFYTVGVCNTATDGFGTFSIAVSPQNFGPSTKQGLKIDLDRFGGNWHLESDSVCVRGQITIETTE